MKGGCAQLRDEGAGRGEPVEGALEFVCRVGREREMSAALNLNQQDDSSFQSLGTPDLSLGSLISAVPTPSKSLRVSSLSSNTTAPSSAPISTPSPPHAPIRRRGSEATPVAFRRHIGRDEDDDPESDALNESQKENNWDGDLGTPLNTKGKRSKSSATNPKGNNLTLRDQEKVCGPSCLL
jgi:hypothetical protein